MWLVLLALFTGGLLVVGGSLSGCNIRTGERDCDCMCNRVPRELPGSAAVRHINTVAARDFPDDRVIDHVLSPIPTNPFCWDVLLLETHGDRYVARHGMLSEAPGLVTAQSCSTKLVSKDTTAPMATVHTADSPDTVWLESSRCR